MNKNKYINSIKEKTIYDTYRDPFLLLWNPSFIICLDNKI